VREQARLALGEALLRNGKAKDALAVFTIAEKSPTKDVATQGVYGAALSLEAQKQWGAAAARWSKLASLSTANDAKARAHLRQGVALAKAKQVASLAAFDKAIAVDPKSELAAQALYESAWAAHDLKQAAQESARWTRLASEYSSSPYAAEANLQRGEALFVTKNWNEAANAYRVVTQNHASSEVAPLAWYKMASAFYNLRNWSEAASAFDKAATFSKSSIAVESNFWAAQSWRQAGGDMNAARARYETFIGAASTPNAANNIKQLLPSARLGLGQTLAASNDWERAVTVYRAGLAGASGGVAAELNYRLGEALSQSGNNKDAATQWLKVVINYPQSEWAARAQWQAAQLLEKTGDRDAAIANYRALSQRQPANEWTAQAQDRLKTLQ
jgi:TolA-binding protein